MPTQPEPFGVLNINKVAGCTSRDVVNVIQRLIRPVKCGHAGTLDPMATGVLLVCVGPATRLTTLAHSFPKTYVAEFTLGMTSDTDDSSGKITEMSDPRQPSLSEIESGLHQLTGALMQIPPAFSAVHVNGQRAYKLAREGQEVELSAKSVQVHSIRLISCDWPRLEVEIECSSGTYIRSIARDLGQQLGCGGLMSRLERTRIGPFTVEDAIAVEDVSKDRIQNQLSPAIGLVSNVLQYSCNASDRIELNDGRRITPRPEGFHSSAPSTAGQQVALVDESARHLLALAEWKEDQTLQPRTVFKSGFPSP